MNPFKVHWFDIINWEGVTGDEGQKMCEAQDNWNKLVEASKRLTNIVAQDFERFMKKHKECSSMLNIESATPNCKPEIVSNFRIASSN